MWRGAVRRMMCVRPSAPQLALMSECATNLQAACSHLTKSGYPVRFGIVIADAGAGRRLAADAGRRWGVKESVRLWRPSPCLLRLLPQLQRVPPPLAPPLPLSAVAPPTGDDGEGEGEGEESGVHGRRGTSRRLALDIGCGSGRDCVWLAQQPGSSGGGGQQQPQPQRGGEREAAEEEREEDEAEAGAAASGGWHCVGLDHLPKMLQRFRLLAECARPQVRWI